jgi:hypothetical protein
VEKLSNANDGTPVELYEAPTLVSQGDFRSVTAGGGWLEIELSGHQMYH